MKKRKLHVRVGSPWHGEGKSIARGRCGRIVNIKQTVTFARVVVGGGPKAVCRTCSRSYLRSVGK